jgi:hypothetical protein
MFDRAPANIGFRANVCRECNPHYFRELREFVFIEMLRNLSTPGRCWFSSFVYFRSNGAAVVGFGHR